MKDIADKLRQIPSAHSDVCRTAADDIDRLTAENEKLRYTLQQIAIGNVGCIVKSDETAADANLRVIKNIAAECLNQQSGSTR